MPLTNEDIRERFEVAPDGVIVYRKIDVMNAPRWARSTADRLNARAGQAVEFTQHARGGWKVRVDGADVYEKRIRDVLGLERAERGKEGTR